MSAGIAAGVTFATRTALDRRTDGLRRTNYRGTSVSLAGGPSAAAGILAAMVGTGAPAGGTLAVAGAAAAGYYDDRLSGREDEAATKGFAGHLRSVSEGKASAGLVKLAVIGATSLAGAAIQRGASFDAVIDGALVAGAANLANLFDLRPGRALKLASLAAVAATPGSGDGSRTVLVAVQGVAAAALPADLGERTMLGDTGANAIGAALGVAVCGRSRQVRLGVLTAVVGLTALSERVSFTAVIAASPVLRRLDELGRAVG